MKTIQLAIIGIQPLLNGGAAVLTRPSKENPSATGVHQLSAGQLQRIATRSLKMNSPFAATLLMQAIETSNGEGVLSIQVEEIKAGTPWENKATGEKGTHGDKNGGKDWTKYSNHEIRLGTAAMLSIMGATAQHALATATHTSSVVPAAKRVPFGVTGGNSGAEGGAEGSEGGAEGAGATGAEGVQP